VKYAMLICGIEDEWRQAEPEAGDEAMKEVFAWFERWGQAGKIANGGQQLDSVRTARTIRVGPDGGRIVTDGPYLELKEVVGGVVFLQADDLDDAVAVAATWPISGSTSIEVRPVIEH
jgi:hypothetical protein